MQIVLDLPEDIAGELEAGGGDLSRAALEGLALEGYRSGKLSESQVRRMLGFGTRYEVRGVLEEHGTVLRYSGLDLESDIDNARTYGEQWLSSQTPRA